MSQSKFLDWLILLFLYKLSKMEGKRASKIYLTKVGEV